MNSSKVNKDNLTIYSTSFQKIILKWMKLFLGHLEQSINTGILDFAHYIHGMWGLKQTKQ